MPTGAVEARHVSLGDEDAQYPAIGAVLGGLTIVVSTLAAAAIRVAADYPQSLLGTLLIPLVGGAVVSWAASRIVLVVFGRLRGLRAQAEPTALVVGAIAPAVAIVALHGRRDPPRPSLRRPGPATRRRRNVLPAGPGPCRRPATPTPCRSRPPAPRGAVSSRAASSP